MLASAARISLASLAIDDGRCSVISSDLLRGTTVARILTRTHSSGAGTLQVRSTELPRALLCTTMQCTVVFTRSGSSCRRLYDGVESTVEIFVT